jgi:hypothetical protein
LKYGFADVGATRALHVYPPVIDSVGLEASNINAIERRIKDGNRVGKLWRAGDSDVRVACAGASSIVRCTSAVAVSVPLMAVKITVYSPASSAPLTVAVTLVPVWAGLGVKTTSAPAGKSDALRVTESVEKPVPN